MNPTEELCRFLSDWGGRNGYTFYVPEGNDEIKLIHIDIVTKNIYINGVNMDNVISPN